MRAILIAVVLALLILAACQTSMSSSTPRSGTPASTRASIHAISISFPPDVNPLSGLRVTDPSSLKIPALLVSISHFPATARPQSGLSFAPYVYEYYITEGATRFLAVFYGESPMPEVPVTGGCETRTGPFVQTGILLGNRVWLDENGNGIQDPGEGGVSGMCVNLYDARGNLIERASTDSNGYYGFNVKPGQYRVAFVKPPGYKFTKANAGDDQVDSDADPVTGEADVNLVSDDLSVDAGLVPSSAAVAASAVPAPLAVVGPVRSGRLIYRYIAKYYANSCLVYAFASEEVLKKLPQCHMVFHQLVAGGYMMDLSEMQGVAQENLQAKGSDFNYASNAYAATPPPGGQPASLLKEYFAYLNQSGWAYDSISQSYLRYVDTSEFDQAGVLHPEIDRLTGRQLSVQNVVMIYAEHQVISPTNLDIHLDRGATGKAVLFRNGRMYDITWTTAEQPGDDGQVRPIHFLANDGNPVALEPGHTWVIVVTPDSKLEETGRGQWQLTFAQPPGAK